MEIKGSNTSCRSRLKNNYLVYGYGRSSFELMILLGDDVMPEDPCCRLY